MSRELPGRHPVEWRRYGYVECSGPAAWNKLFREVTAFDESSPPSSGGVIEECVAIRPPDGPQLYGLSYKGDFEAWRQTIEGNCRKLGLLFGTIRDDRLVLSDGREFPIDECAVEFL